MKQERRTLRETVGRPTVHNLVCGFVNQTHAEKVVGERRRSDGAILAFAETHALGRVCNQLYLSEVSHGHVIGDGEALA